MKLSATIQKSLLALAACGGIAMGSVNPALARGDQQSARIDTGGESAVSQSIILPLNKAAIVDLPQPAADVLVSQPSVVDAVVRSPRKVYLLGQEVGETNAFFFDSRGNQILNLEIRVERDLKALTDLIERLMPDSRITAEAINDSIILRGTVQNSVEAANAAKLTERFVLDASKVISMINIRDREQVMLKVRIVEMKRTILKQLGFDPSGLATLSGGDQLLNIAASNIAPGGGASGLAATATRFLGGNDESNVNLAFQALEQNGLIRTLAEPNLTALSGEAANFLAGGEFPIPIGQTDGVISIEFKEFGVGLGFTPVVMGKGRINLKVETEVSELTAENSFTIASTVQQVLAESEEEPFLLIDTDGDGIPEPYANPNYTEGQASTQSTPGLTIPGLSVRRAKTTVELPSGGSMVLAGLLQEDMRQTINGIPGLKDTPIIGQLFRSRDYQNDESELVIIVTPYLVDPTHKSKLTDPTEGFVPASDTQSILLGRMVSAYGLHKAGAEEKTLQGPMGFILD